jgi:hypothetical protein
VSAIVVIGNDCTSSCKFNYHTTTTAQVQLRWKVIVLLILMEFMIITENAFSMHYIHKHLIHHLSIGDWFKRMELIEVKSLIWAQKGKLYIIYENTHINDILIILKKKAICIFLLHNQPTFNNFVWCNILSSRLVVNTNMDISSEDLTLAKRDDIFWWQEINV